MTDNEDIGLDEKLRSKTSLANKQRFRDSLTVDAQEDRAFVTEYQLQAAAVGTSGIADNSVSTAKIQNSAVTSDKIASEAVDSSEIAGSAVDGTHIADNAVDTTQLASGAVTNVIINDYDLAKGTGNTLSAGTSNMTASYEANGTVGTSTTFSIVGTDSVSHDMTFTYGLLTSYGTS